MSDAEIRKALDEATGWARRKAPADFSRELAVDSATDAVCYAVRHFDPAKGEFRSLCRRLVRQFVMRALANYRRGQHGKPDVLHLDGDDGFDPPARNMPSAGEVPVSADLKDLPDDLGFVVRLVYIDGYSLADAGLLMGVCAATVRQRLIEAAHLLAPGLRQPDRAKNSKRLSVERMR